MPDDEIPTRPPAFGEAAGPPPMAEPAPESAAEPKPATATASPAGRSNVRTWVGAAIGVVAIAVAALVGTGIVSSDASTGGRGGPGGFRGNGAPPGFTGGQGGFPGQFRGGFRGGGQVPATGTFDPRQQAPTSPTSTPRATLS